MTTMSTDEREVWLRVYCISFQKGSSFLKASKAAEQAVKNFQAAFDKPGSYRENAR
jgi:hypothetical protein